jgi:hypothetical protein
MLTIPDCKVSDVNSFILLNASAPIVVTFPGIVNEVRLVPTNAAFPICVTPVPIEADVTWLLILKALFAILVTVLGIVTLPTQLELLTRTLFVIVKNPEVPQATSPLVPL